MKIIATILGRKRELRLRRHEVLTNLHLESISNGSGAYSIIMRFASGNWTEADVVDVIALAKEGYRGFVDARREMVRAVNENGAGTYAILATKLVEEFSGFSNPQDADFVFNDAPAEEAVNG